MTTTVAQQVDFDNALVPLEKGVKIGKCNMRINHAKTQKEPTYQVVLDALALTTYYTAFLITTNVPKINMHITIDKKDSTAYRFKIDKKRYKIDIEVFREIFQICPKLPNQEFDALPLDEEIVSFVKELGHKGDIKPITQVKNVDFVELLWEDFTFQIDNNDHKKQENMYYPRFTKAIIHHFITKDKLISTRNKMFMHTTKDDSILGLMRFVSKADDHQVYGELLPKNKEPATTDRSKGIHLLSEVALLKEDQVKKALKRSRRETTIHQAGDSSDGTSSKLGVPDEPKGRSVDIDEGTGLKPRVPDVSKTYSSESEMSRHKNKPRAYRKKVVQKWQVFKVSMWYKQQQLLLLPYKMLLLRLSDLEKEVKELKNVDQSLELLSTIKFTVTNAVKEYLGTSLDDALYKDYSKGKSPSTSLKSSKSCKSAKDQAEEPIFVQDSDYAKHDDAEFDNTDMPMDQGEKLGKTNEQPNDEYVPKYDWYKKSRSDTSPDLEWNEGKLVNDRPEKSWFNDMAKATKPPLTFDELMHTPIDFSAFAMNRLKIDNLTKEHLVGPIYNLLKGMCKTDFFFNNDLEYLRGGRNEKKYTASTTKSKAARILSIISVKVNEWYRYGHLEEIVVKRADQQLYTFKEGDFKRLHLNDIEDMLLLIVQNKLNNLNGNVIVHLAASLRMFARRTVIQTSVHHSVKHSSHEEEEMDQIGSAKDPDYDQSHQSKAAG
nr:hypothetical protein [Tanacetum cinerariifolium]